MKKKIIAFVFGAAICSSTAFAQESGFGAKLGLNLATISTDAEDSDPGMRTSLHIGAYYNYMVSDKFAIQPELVYSGQGAKETADILGTEIEVTSKLDYINIPIMAKYYITEGFHLHAGPQFGILMSAKAKVEIDGESEEDDLEDVSTLDIGLGIGLGYELESGLNFGFRYNLGFTNINSGDYAEEVNTTNRVMQIGVGYSF